MSADTADGPTASAVRERLDRVTDPELDTSIVELGYVDEVRVEGHEAVVAFTLPTAWCSPAFAWMMAVDARDEAEALPGVDRARVELREHMHDEAISRGVTERQTFGEAFPDADGGIAAGRAKLDDKARIARQHEATGALLDAGLSGDQIARLTLDDVSVDEDRAHVWVDDGALAVSVDADPVADYLEKARAVDLFDDDDALFRTPEGERVDPEEFDLVRKRTRLARVNMGGQGSVCDALHEARRADDRPPLSSD
jgi:metal-sulfur cluster biosynthetic enzyme